MTLDHEEERRRDLHRRLSRLGRVPRPSPMAPPARPASLPGVERLTPLGPAFLREETYPRGHLHGGRPLESVLAFPPDLVADLAGAPASPTGLVYLDTETTGLAGGAGTLVFLVGVGWFEAEGFRLRQYFLRDPAEEPAMLHALLDDLAAAEGVVTFNGRAFDLPLLEMRFTIGLRRPAAWQPRSHLDLLPPARRLWRRALPDCRLGTLEAHVLGVHRSEADVPGEEIPGIYLDYLRTGDTRDIERVMYHNAVDVLSLVGLAAEVLSRHAATDPGRLTGAEALALARWHERAGRADPAEAAYRVASADRAREVQVEALRHYAAYLKRQRRYLEAVEAWQAWHALAPEDPRPCVELAKAFEWHLGDLAQAEAWARRGLVCLSHWPPGWRRERLWGELEHRLRRLERKRRRAG